MNIRERTFFSVLLLLALLVIPLGTALARPVFPEVISLPDGFQPEGIVIGKGHTFYAGSLANGAIYQGDLRTGEGSLLVEGETGRVAVGLGYDQRSGYLFVSGGPTGYAYVYDTRTGEEVASYQLSTTNSFINDVEVTRQAAYFTNSFEGVIYRLPLGPAGSLPDASEVEAIPLEGDWVQSPNAFNANGIEATQNGEALIIVNSVMRTLYLVDPDTGVADEIELEGGDVENGDGLVLQGKTLYVVQNRLNQVAVVQLAADFSSGEITRVITDPDFRVPTTVDIFGNGLYLVNARFGTPPGPDTEYEVVRVPVR